MKGWELDSVLVTLSCPKSEVSIPYFISDRTEVKRGVCLPKAYSASLEAGLVLVPRLLSSKFVLFSSFCTLQLLTPKAMTWLLDLQ